MDIHIEPNAAAASAYTAARIVRRLTDAVDRRDAASIAFSGGSTPRSMLALLADTGLPWKSITAYQVDERVAPDGDPDRNAGMLDVLPLPKRNLKLMPVTATNHVAACRRYAAGLPERFDVIHLGLGDDGHTASWPPGDPVVAVTDPVAMCGMFNGRIRMTLTPAVVNAARWRIVEVSGAGKAAAVRGWIDDDCSLPITHVRRTGTLASLDQPAASRL